ncbi:MAG: RHS repeat-associated core domain-containing protein, partial [Candidatus Sedimenticola endophacoides]
MTDGSGAVVYSYDIRGNLTGKSVTLDAIAYSLQYGYDNANRLIRITYPGGRTVDYSYDALGQISAINTTKDGATQSLASAIVYQPFGPLSGLTHGNGLTHSRGHDLDYRLTSLTTPGVQDLLNGYDPAGNISAIADNLTGANSQNFSYDALDRLTGALGGYGGLGYGYDANGNRLNKDDDGTSVTYSIDSLSNRLLAETDWTYAHDAVGNQTEKLDATGAGQLYSYGDHNRLVQVIQREMVQTSKSKKKPLEPQDSVIAEYRYNGQGQRVKKTAGGVIAYYVYGNDGELLAELDSAGEITKGYVYLAGAPIALIETRASGGGAGTETLIDNGEAGTGSTGAWTLETDRKEQNYGADFLLADGDSGSTYRWTPVLGAGTYEVYAWWKSSRKYNPTAQYRIVHGGVTDTSVQSQRDNGGQWVLLGTYDFDGTGGEYVEVSDAGGDTVADAIRFVEQIPPSRETRVYTVHSDHLGTPRVITDNNQRIVWRWDSTPFGVSGPDEDPDGDGEGVVVNLRFPGQYYDQESGLYYNYFRTYDPSTGRYL